MICAENSYLKKKKKKGTLLSSLYLFTKKNCLIYKGGGGGGKGELKKIYTVNKINVCYYGRKRRKCIKLK